MRLFLAKRDAGAVIGRLAVVLLASTAVAAAQERCPSGEAPFGDLGIGLYQCAGANCQLSGRNSLDTVHVFDTEPTVWHLTGVALSQLRAGDALVAIDGLPITTAAGGAKLATIKPGERATLLIRRDGVTRAVAIPALASCERPSIQVTSRAGETPDEVNRKAFAGFGTLGPRGRGQQSTDFRGAMGSLPKSVPTDSAGRVGLTQAAALEPGDIVVAVEPISPSAGGSARTLRVTVRRAGVLQTLLISPRPTP